MKKLIMPLLFAGVLTQGANAQVTKKTLDLPEFKSIYVNSGYTVYLKQTNKQEVTVEALTEIFEASDIKVENGILMVNIERKPDNPNKSLWAKIDDIKVNPAMKLYVSVKSIEDLQVNGSGRIISENSIASYRLNLAVTGSGSMDLDIKGENVKAEVSGAGTLLLKGYAMQLDALISGSGNIRAFDCPVESSNVKLSGSGNCELNVSETIDAMVVGSGQVKHKGNTKMATKKIYGSGTVERAY